MTAGLPTGANLPVLERTLGSADLVAYAGATWDWHRMHHDRRFAEELGFPAPVVDGQLFGALLVEQLQDAYGTGAFVRELDLRYRAPVFVDESIRCEGTVTVTGLLRHELDLRVVAIATDGAERVAVTATAVVEEAT